MSTPAPRAAAEADAAAEPRRHRFAIDRTWDGRPIPRDDVSLVTLTSGGALPPGVLEILIDARLRDDPPPAAPPGSVDGLWHHEVVEVFIAGDIDGDERVPYTEIEIGPHGHYLVLRFAGRRRRIAAGLPLDLRTEIDGRRWRAVAQVSSAHLPPPPFRCAAFAIHGPADDRRHLAAHPLPGPEPDFHRPTLFRPVAVGDAG